MKLSCGFDGGATETGKEPFCGPTEKKPTDVFRKFVSVFESKGWLNRPLRIKHHDRRYRICCSQREFLAYRIDDHCDVLPGFPGWVVCIVNPNQMIEDSDMSANASVEPMTHDWLRCIAEGDFELI